jgi:hypothetical protein
MADTDICNAALGQLGVSVEIANLDTERSKEGKACRRYYADTRDEILRDFAWPFATVIEALQLVTDFTAGTAAYDWPYAYRYPANALAVRRLLLDGSGRLITRRTVPRYLFGRDASGLLIYADLQSASVEYTYAETDTSRFPPDFRAALTHLLAAKIGPLVAGEKVQLIAGQYALYDAAIRKARANALNEQRRDPDDESELVRGRGAGDVDCYGRGGIISPLER